MQKLISSIIIIALMLCPLSAIAENWYITQGENLVGRLCELASDETYATLFTGADDVLEQVRLFAQTDFSEIEEARIFYLPDSEASFSLLSLIGTFSDETFPEFSETVSAELYKRFPAMIISAINGQAGVSWLAASTMLTTSETYVQPEDFRSGILLLEYPGDFAVAVAFMQTGTDTVTVSATAVSSSTLEMLTGEMSLFEKAAFEILIPRID